MTAKNRNARSRSEAPLLISKLSNDGFDVLPKPILPNTVELNQNGSLTNSHSTTSAPAMLAVSDNIKGELDGLALEHDPGEPLDEKTVQGPVATGSPPRPVHPRSIEVLLGTTDKVGQYTLNTEDPELRALLKEGFVRSKAGETQKKRSRFSDVVLKKQFTAFDRQNKGRDSATPSFHGFFSLFWMGVALMILKLAATNWRIHGSVLGKNEIFRLMNQDLIMLGAVDCLMMSLGTVSVLLQRLVLTDYLVWSRSGWLIQNVWQTIFLASFVTFAGYRWPWTHRVFITLHTIIMLMKQHSYAFYNGYLSEIYKRKNILQRKLDVLENAEVMAPSSPLATAHATSYFDGVDLNQLSRRRKSIGVRADEADSDIAAVAAAIESDAPVSYDQLRSLRKLMSWEIEALADELKGTCKVTTNYYPHNLSIRGWFEYIPLPTLVYELEYPRQETTDWAYVAEKTTATFGVIFVMIIISTAYIYPVVLSIVKMKEDGIPLQDRLMELPWAFLDLLFPFMMEYLLSWYVIWECLCNVLAELTLFADRGFYADWWNSTSWDQYARDWNRPVHNFLLRFAYHSSITSFKLSRSSATLVTFLLSACVHELVMAVIFGKIRGYLLAMQMMQLPLVVLSRTRFLRGKDILGNLVFWLGIFIGPSFLSALYLFL